jgi:aminoglycoside phosphotransferase (APT) family kinase protein
MVQRDFDHGPDPADPVLDEATVLRFVRYTVPSASKVTGINESGGEARAYVIDDRYILKTQRPHRVRPRTSLKKEVVHLLNIAALAPDVYVPRVLGFGGHTGSIEYILMTRIPGVPVRDVALEGQARSRLLVDLGRSLRRLHSLPLRPFEDTGLFPGDKNAEEVRSRLTNGMRRAVDVISTSDEAWTLGISPEAILEKCTSGIDASHIRAALHANPGPEHVFVDPSTLQFQGIIDFGDAYISHPALDMTRWSSLQDRAALIEGYGSEMAVENSFIATWRAVMVSSLMAIVAGLRPGPVSPARRQTALADLQALAVDL